MHTLTLFLNDTKWLAMAQIAVALEGGYFPDYQPLSDTTDTLLK